MADEKEILIFDIESTGTRAERDQIIELTVQAGLRPEAARKTWRIKPDVPISPGAQAVHRISLDDLKDCPRFPELVDEIRKPFDSCEILVGYHIEFDLKFLQSELRRAKQTELDLASKLIIDPLQLWRRSEPRKLEDAVKRFAGRKLENAHSSAEDVRGTGEVLLGMLEAFKLQGQTWDKIAELADPIKSTWIGPSYHIQWKDKVVIIGFGKHQGKPLSELAKESSGGYLKWIIDTDFPDHVKTIAKEALRISSSELEQWVRDFSKGRGL